MTQDHNIKISELLLPGMYDYLHEGIQDYGEEMDPDMLDAAVGARDQVEAAMDKSNSPRTKQDTTDQVTLDRATIQALLAYIELQSIYITDDHRYEMEEEEPENEEEIAAYQLAIKKLNDDHNITFE